MFTENQEILPMQWLWLVLLFNFYKHSNNNLTREMTFPKMWYVRPAKSQISLCKHTV